jgi:hypothetical protein
MDGGLLSVGMGGRMLQTRDFVHPWSLPNLTQRALDSLFPTIPTNAVRHRHGVIFGMMESGKTSLFNALALEARRRYGSDLNIIPCYSIRRAMDLINGKKVQLILVDDAIREANARQSMKQAQDIADFYQIRHLYEDIAKDRAGIVITMWGCQRFKSLDIVFRQGHVLFFKTSAVDPDDAKLIRDYVGPAGFEELQRITERIYIESDDAAKGQSVISIPIASGCQSGMFKARYVEPWLKWLDDGEVWEPGEAFLFNVGAVLEKLQKERKWRDHAKAYYLAHVEGHKLATIAKRYNVEPSTISRRIDAIKGELSRLAGADYEAWKCQELTRRGYTVEHLGGNSEPDIIATHNETKEVRVISCKCLDFDRKTKLPIAELAPELHEARRRGCPLILSVHNLRDHTDQELTIDHDRPPKVIELTPLGAA